MSRDVIKSQIQQSFRCLKLVAATGMIHELLNYNNLEFRILHFEYIFGSKLKIFIVICIKNGWFFTQKRKTSSKINDFLPKMRF